MPVRRPARARSRSIPERSGRGESEWWCPFGTPPEVRASHNPACVVPTFPNTPQACLLQGQTSLPFPFGKGLGVRSESKSPSCNGDHFCLVRWRGLRAVPVAERNKRAERVGSVLQGHCRSECVALRHMPLKPDCRRAKHHSPSHLGRGWGLGPNQNPRPATGIISVLCAGEDLNLHALRHMALNHACLPIPAPARAGRIIIGMPPLSSRARAKQRSSGDSHDRYRCRRHGQ